jgi:hypothetical protein
MEFRLKAESGDCGTFRLKAELQTNATQAGELFKNREVSTPHDVKYALTRHHYSAV